MKKIVKAVPACNEVTYFRNKVYNAWKSIGGQVAEAHFPYSCFRPLAYRISVPGVFKSKNEARLKFIEPISIHFDSYPDSLFYEMIPLIWDCWPKYDNKVVRWMKLHKVKSCIFTCRQSADRIQKRIPNLNVLVIPEGLNTDLYTAGKELKDRSIDLYTYGRLKKSLIEKSLPSLRVERNGDFKTLLKNIQDAKVTIALPRCDVEPELAEGQETLTQRYWECMLSRMVMVGRSPKELTDLIGYNPVIDVDYEKYEEQIKDIISHIEDYQELVDKNRETALRMAPWEIRMKRVMKWLESLGYEV